MRMEFVLLLILATLWPSVTGGAFAQQVYPGAAIVLAVGLALVTVNRRRLAWVVARWRWLRRRVPHLSSRAYQGLLFAVGLVVFSYFAIVAFYGIPHIEDSVSGLLQAQIFALGRTTAPAPPIPDFFFLTHVVARDGHWYSQYPPGHSAFLTLGVWAHVPWLINPLMGALTLVLLYRSGRLLGGETVGRLAGALGLASPFMLFMSGEFMSHSTALALWAAFAWLFLRLDEKPSFARALVAGLPLGILFITRPLTAVGLAAPFGVWLAVQCVRRRTGWLAAAAGFAPPLAFFGGLLLLYNWATTGSPWVSGYQAAWGKQVLPGFGAVPWGEPHTPMRGLNNSLANFNLFNRFMFEWPFPSTVFVGVAVVARSRQARDWLFFAALFCLSAAYITYWYQDYCLGPRFLYEGAGPTILLTALGLTRLPAMVAPYGAAKRVVQVGLVSLLAFSTVFTFGFRMPELWGLFGNSYWGINGELKKQLVAQVTSERALVFISGRYEKVFPLNSPMLDGRWVIARDLGPRNGELIAKFPDREVWTEREGTFTKVVPGTRVVPARPEDLQHPPPGR
jgi:hypothetical protein